MIANGELGINGKAIKTVELSANGIDYVKDEKKGTWRRRRNKEMGKIIGSEGLRGRALKEYKLKFCTIKGLPEREKKGNEDNDDEVDPGRSRNLTESKSNPVALAGPINGWKAKHRHSIEFVGSISGVKKESGSSIVDDEDAFKIKKSKIARASTEIVNQKDENQAGTAKDSLIAGDVANKGIVQKEIGKDDEKQMDCVESAPCRRNHHLMALMNGKDSLAAKEISQDPLIDNSRSMLITKEIEPMNQEVQTIKVEATVPADKAEFFMTQGSGEFMDNKDTIEAPQSPENNPRVDDADGGTEDAIIKERHDPVITGTMEIEVKKKASMASLGTEMTEIVGKDGQYPNKNQDDSVEANFIIV